MSEHKHVSGVAYVVVFIALLGAATLSLGLHYLHWKTGGLVVSLAIAVIKALLVLFFFMHLVEQRFSNRLTVLMSVLFVALLVGLTTADVATRQTQPAMVAPAPDEAFYGR